MKKIFILISSKVSGLSVRLKELFRYTIIKINLIIETSVKLIKAFFENHPNKVKLIKVNSILILLIIVF
jgi:hypothetical protein